MNKTPRPADPTFSAADLDLDVVADDLADALDADDAAALHELLARDPAARARHDELADALDGVAAVLAAQPHPALPDEVLIRLDAALTRESTARAADEPVGTPGATGAAGPAGGPVPAKVRSWRRAFRPWAGGLLGTAAVVGGLLFALHSAGGNSTTATSAESAAASLAPARAAAGAGAPSAAALASRAAPALPEPDLAGSPVTVTATSLASVVRALFAPGTDHAFRAASPGPKVANATSSADDDLCLPAGFPVSATVVSRDPVTFRGGPATLLVLHEQGSPTHVVRADVFRTCGTAVLLTNTVALTH